MALILLYDVKPVFKEKLLAALDEGRDFIIKTQYGRDDTLPSLLLQLLYRKLKAEHIDDYDLRTWADEGGRITIRATYEGDMKGSDSNRY